MNGSLVERNHRVLVIDDNPSIQEDFRKVLGDEDPLRVAEAKLFGTPEALTFQMSFASQGEEGLLKVQRSLTEGHPYAMAFIDVRMPPGWDGVETTLKLWEVDPDLQVVICTAYSDYSWSELTDVLGQSEQLLILKKPFDTIEVVQLAHALTEKWRLQQASRSTVAQLEEAVGARTAELAYVNDALRIEIGERTAVELILRQAQAELAGHVETTTKELKYVKAALDAHTIVSSTDEDGKIIFVNDKFCTISKYSREELLGQDHRILNSRHHPSEFFTDLRSTIARGEVWKGEMRNRAKDGTLNWLDTTIVPFLGKDGKPSQYVTLRTDITEQKHAEEELLERTRRLHESEQRYRFLLETMPQIIWTSAPDGNLDYYNQRWYEYTGMTFEQTKNWGWKPVLHPDDVDNCVRQWTASFTTGCNYQVEYRFKRAADGTYRWHLGRAFPMRNEEGTIVHWVGTCTDIDDYKRAQESLSEAHASLEERVAERTRELDAAKRRLQSVLDAATQISIIATDTEGLITVFNSGAERILGYEASEIVGRRTPAALHLESEVAERGREVSEAGKAQIVGFDVFVEGARDGRTEEREWTYVRKDGSHLTVTLVVTALRDASGALTGFLGVASDITARKRIEGEVKAFRSELEHRIVEATNVNASLQRQTEELRQLSEERAALANMNELLAACSTPSEAYDIFGRTAPELFPGSVGELHIYTASRNELTPAYTWGSGIDAMPMNPEDCWAIRRGKCYLGNGTTTPLCEHAGPVHHGATICAPLMAYGEGLGVLHVRILDPAAARSTVQLATMVGDSLAIALANLKLRQSLKALSIRDPLTGLFNRRYLDETLAREVSRARRERAPVAVIMLDVDHFKQYNDRFGHKGGDALLRELGILLLQSTRSSDIACRYGGEEFCLVLPEMDRAGAHARAETIRAAVARLSVTLDGRALDSVTCSLGVAVFPDYGSEDLLLHAADEALYEAKRSGRDRVVLSSAGSS